MQPAIKLSPTGPFFVRHFSVFLCSTRGSAHGSDPFVFLISASKISASNPSNWLATYAINARYSLFSFDGASANPRSSSLPPDLTIVNVAPYMQACPECSLLYHRC